jgi:hypothetical protein
MGINHQNVVRLLKKMSHEKGKNILTYQAPKNQ